MFEFGNALQVQELEDEAEKLKLLHPDSTDQIAAKNAEISMLWETLKHKARHSYTWL